MKKLMIFFIVAATMFSCSDDDVVATPLEGTWLLTYFVSGGTPVEGDPIPDPDVTDQNIRYRFTGNQYLITREAEVTNSGTFTFEANDIGYYDLSLKDSSSEYIDRYSLSFSEHRDTIFLNGMVGDFYTLKKIQ